jgi:deoxyribodipyrimidine photo-lyase
VRCIYVIEPQLWLQPDCALQHFEFVNESLQELDAFFRTLGGSIEIHEGDMTEVLARIKQEEPFSDLFSHEETGNGFTYSRDLEVAAWCQSNGVAWREFPQFGVVRRLKDRNLWQGEWERHMAAPLQNFESLTFWRTPSPEHFSFPAPTHLTHNPPLRQRGGRTLALKTLYNFLNARSLGYRGGISSPLSRATILAARKILLAQTPEGIAVRKLEERLARLRRKNQTRPSLLAGARDCTCVAVLGFGKIRGSLLQHFKLEE